MTKKKDNPAAEPVPTEAAAPVRLTSLSHGGGCGCKIAPGVLSEILKSSGANAVIAALTGHQHGQWQEQE